MVKLVHFKDIDIEKISFEIDQDYSTVWVLYESDRVLFQFPKMSSVFKETVGQWKDTENYSMCLKHNQEVEDKLTELEKKYLTYVGENYPKIKKNKKAMSYEKILENELVNVNMVKSWNDLNFIRFKLALEKDDKSKFALDLRFKSKSGDISNIKLDTDEKDKLNGCEMKPVARLYGNFTASITFSMKCVRMIAYETEDSEMFLEETDEEGSDEESKYSESESI